MKFRSPFIRNLCSVLLVSLLAAGAFVSPAPHLLAAPASTSTIAYLRPNDATGDEIHLIAPDASNDREIWSTGVADPQHVYDILGLAWRPDGTELAFDSSHENWCSLNGADLYVVGVNGQGYRRITDAPACGARGGYPTGTVIVPVRNNGLDSFTGFVYFQGAPGIQMVSVPPGGSATVTFKNVADFGTGVMQIATRIVGNYRDIDLGTGVDVVANGTVTTGPMSLYLPYNIDWQVHSPTWRNSGAKLGYVLNFHSFRQIDPNPAPLDFGDDLLTGNQSDLPDFVDFLSWGPTAATADQLLYVGNAAFQSEGIYRVTEGSATAGDLLLSYDVTERILGLAWLPDGSGFVFTKKNFQDTFTLYSADVFVYSFATKQATQLTHFDNEFAGRISVAPDGGQFVFERSSTLEDEYGDRLTDPDLWIMKRDGTGLQLLVKHGRAPAWGPLETATPSPTPSPTPVPGAGGKTPLYLPLIKH